MMAAIGIASATTTAAATVAPALIRMALGASSRVAASFPSREVRSLPAPRGLSARARLSAAM